MERPRAGRVSARTWSILGVAVIVALVACLLPASSLARKPIISYVENNQLNLYDAELGKDLAPLPITIANANQFRYAISKNGRYVLFTDANKDLHLLDRQTSKEVPLPGVDVYANPGFPSVSDTGRLAFDDNGNGPALVYDGSTGQFVPTGFPTLNSGHRQTQLSGGGNWLATTCGPVGDCVVDLGTDSNPYVQNLVTRTDAGIPDDDNADEEDPCISGDSVLVGWHKGNAVQKDVFIYNRITGSFLNLPGLNHPADDDTFCVLDAAGDFIGFQRQNDPTLKLYQRSSSSLVPLPARILPPGNNLNNLFSAPRCGGKFATMIGSEGPDKIKGSKRADVILALEGRDTLKGLAGNDVICGGKGRDRLVGGKGNDKLLGEQGKDTLIGGPGKDKLKGGKGRDTQTQ